MPDIVIEESTPEQSANPNKKKQSLQDVNALILKEDGGVRKESGKQTVSSKDGPLSMIHKTNLSALNQDLASIGQISRQSHKTNKLEKFNIEKIRKQNKMK